MRLRLREAVRQAVAEKLALERSKRSATGFRGVTRNGRGFAAEIGDGMVFANGARSHMGKSLAALPEDKRTDDAFYIGNMIPTCISEDIEAAKAVNRRTLTSYVQLPNYQNYWREAGYVEEMDAIAAAVEAGLSAGSAAFHDGRGKAQQRNRNISGGSRNPSPAAT